MNENQPGFVHGCKQETATAGTYAAASFLQPLQAITPTVDDVGVILNGMFYPIIVEQPAAMAPVAMVDVTVDSLPNELPTDPLQLAMPVVVNSHGVCAAVNGYQRGSDTEATLRWIELYDLPAEGSAGFDDSLLDSADYVASTVTFYSASETEEDGIEYIWSGAAVANYPVTGRGYAEEPYPEKLSRDSAGVITTLAERGERWGPITAAQQPVSLLGRGKYIYVRAFKRGRRLSDVRIMAVTAVIYAITVEYDEDTAILSFSLPYSGVAGTTVFYLANAAMASDRVTLTTNKAGSTPFNAKKTLADGNVAATKTFMLTDIIGAGNHLYLKNEATIASGLYTRSFKKTLITPISTQNYATAKTSVAVLLDRKPDYYISPDGGGDGLTPDNPASWAAILGRYSESTQRVVCGADEPVRVASTVNMSGKLIWAAAGTYSTDDAAYNMLFSGNGATIMGGWVDAFSSRSGESVLASPLYGWGPSYGTIQNFKITIFRSGGLLNFIGCDIIASATEESRQLVATRIHDCNVDVWGAVYIVLAVARLTCSTIKIRGSNAVISSGGTGAIIDRCDIQLYATEVAAQTTWSEYSPGTIASAMCPVFTNSEIYAETVTAGDGLPATQRNGGAGASSAIRIAAADTGGGVMRNCRVTAVFGRPGNGGAAINELNLDSTGRAGSSGLYLPSQTRDCEFNITMPAAGSGSGYSAGCNIISGPTAWVDCEFNGTIGAYYTPGPAGGLYGPKANAFHPDGFDGQFITESGHWDENDDWMVDQNQVIVTPSAGYRGGRGGNGATTQGNNSPQSGAAGGNGWPVDGHETPGAGGVRGAAQSANGVQTYTNGADGYYVGDYWELGS